MCLYFKDLLRLSFYSR